LTLAQADAEIINFASIANTGTPLFCVIEKYEFLPDYIDALPNKTAPPDPKA